MRISASHRGRQRPFEGDRRIVLRRVPAGATVRHATATVVPHSTDDGRPFVETISFSGPRGDWGATKSLTPGAVEVDFHARRRLHSIRGSGLATGSLLVDLGGGFVGVTAEGGIGAASAFPVENDGPLPGLTVTGLRVAGGAAARDVAVVRVTSPPSNVTLALDGGPPVWTRLGDLVDAETTPDFAALLQAAVQDAPVEHGFHVLTFVVHSDTLARLDVDLALDLAVGVDALPPGVDNVTWPYAYNSLPEVADAGLRLSVPAGLAAVAGESSGRAQGAFDGTRVVAGPLGATAVTDEVVVSAAAPQAQPVELPAAAVVSSVDLLVAAVTPSVTFEVDLLEDLDGRPAGSSVLASTARRTLTRDDAPGLTWVNVALPAGTEFPPDRRHWLTLHAVTGSAVWGAGAGEEEPGLHRTTDGGLSWRATPSSAAGPLAAGFRLRHGVETFRMPVALEVTGAAGDVRVDLGRFEPQGRLDLNLDLPEMAGAVNEALTGDPTGTEIGAEHVANGDFSDWLRVGATVTWAGSVSPEPPARLVAAAFSPDGQRLYLLGDRDGRARLVTQDTLCRVELAVLELGGGEPTALVVGAAGTLAVVSFRADDVVIDSHQSLGGFLRVVDLDAGRVVGEPVPTPHPVVGLADSADGRVVYVLGDDDGSSALRAVRWDDLAGAAAGAAALEQVAVGRADAADVPVALAVGPGGPVYLLGRDEQTGTGRLRAFDEGLDAAGPVLGPVGATTAGPGDLAATPSGEHLVVVGSSQVRMLRADDLTPTADLAFEGDPVRVAVDPYGAVALIAQEGPLAVLDLATARIASVPVAPGAPAALAVSPAGDSAVVTDDDEAVLLRIGPVVPAEWELTAGTVAPSCLETTMERIALLGDDEAAGPSAISQLLPVAAGRRYRLTFAGLAGSDGAVAEVLWYAAGCGLIRADELPIATIDLTARAGAALARHELDMAAPAEAEQAELRFRTVEGVAGVDAASLAPVRASLANTGLVPADGAVPGWEVDGGTLVARPADGGTLLHNPGPAPAALVQDAGALPGAMFGLELHARAASAVTGGGDAAVEVRWLDEVGAPVGDPVRLAVGTLAFDALAAGGEVPPGVAVARLAVVVPAGTSVEVDGVTLEVAEARAVRVGFVAEAPGELTVTDLRIALDEAPVRRPGVPPGGLCRATPPPAEPGRGDARTCYCATCAADRPVRGSAAVETAAGRPGSVAPCPTCGRPRLRLGGRPVDTGDQAGIPAFRAPSPPRALAATRRPPAAPSLEAIRGVFTAREAMLRNLGIHSLAALADATPERVATLPGVSIDMARDFVEQAARLAREQRLRLFGRPPPPRSRH